MKKGDLVKLNPNDPEIMRLLDWPFGEKKYMASRPSTPEERDDWRKARREAIEEAHKKGGDTFSIAFDDAGESRLPPRSVSVSLPLDGIYVVERARCRVQLGWGNATGGLARILDTNSGEHAYVPREMLKVISN